MASWVGSALVLGMLSKTVPWRLSVPRSLADIRPLVAVSAALLVAQVTNSVTYSFTTMVASKAGTTAAAAHQISLQIWWLLSYFPVPLYLAAQSLLAGAAGAPRRGVVGVQARKAPSHHRRPCLHRPPPFRSHRSSGSSPSSAYCELSNESHTNPFRDLRRCVFVAVSRRCSAPWGWGWRSFSPSQTRGSLWASRGPSLTVPEWALAQMHKTHTIL